MRNPWNTPQSYKGSPLNVIRGQRFVPDLSPTGTIIVASKQLVRAEDPSLQINHWQLVLSPIFTAQVGAMIQGDPARHLNGDGTGMYLVTMTWGAGGVNYTTDFPYPVAGASFSVAGDNVMLTARTQDFFGVYTEANKPCFNVWVTPTAIPLSPRPLTEWFQTGLALAGINEIPPWARTLTVTKDTLAATVLVEYAIDVVGAFVPIAIMNATDDALVLPVPQRALQVRLTPSAGKASGLLDIVFT